MNICEQNPTMPLPAGFLRFSPVFSAIKKRKIKQTAQTNVKPELTRLKELSPDKQLAVMEILEARTYKEARPLVKQLVGFPCSINLLWKFRSWHVAEQELSDNTDLLQQIETFLRQRNGNWSVERIRKVAISFLMMHALARRDVKAFVTIAGLPLHVKHERLNHKRFELDTLKFEESLRTKVDAGIDALAKQIKDHPLALRYYHAMKDVLEGRQPEIELPKPKPVEKPNQIDIAA